MLVDLTRESDANEDLICETGEILKGDSFSASHVAVKEDERVEIGVPAPSDEVIDLTMESEISPTNDLTDEMSFSLGDCNPAYDEKKVSRIGNDLECKQEADEAHANVCHKPKFTVIRQDKNRQRLIVDCEYCIKKNIQSFDYAKHVRDWHKENFKDTRAKCSICKGSIHYVLQYYHAAAYHNGQQMYTQIQDKREGESAKRWNYRIFFLPVQEDCGPSHQKKRSMKMKCLLCNKKTTVIRAKGCWGHFSKCHVSKEAT